MKNIFCMGTIFLVIIQFLKDAELMSFFRFSNLKKRQKDKNIYFKILLILHRGS